MLRLVLRLPLLYPLIAFLLARRVVIQGWSMHPTLAPGERVLFDTLAYRLERPRRGDVILARHPACPSTKLVKRVAGIPGDRVIARGDRWRVEDASSPSFAPSEGAADSAAQVWSLGEDEYFLVGDAPDLSTDARHFGPTKAPDIQGCAWLVYWPPNRLRSLRRQQPG